MGEGRYPLAPPSALTSELLNFRKATNIGAPNFVKIKKKLSVTNKEANMQSNKKSSLKSFAFNFSLALKRKLGTAPALRSAQAQFSSHFVCKMNLFQRAV